MLKAGVRSPGTNHPLSIVARTRAPVVVQEDAMRKIFAETRMRRIVRR